MKDRQDGGHKGLSMERPTGRRDLGMEKPLSDGKVYVKFNGKAKAALQGSTWDAATPSRSAWLQVFSTPTASFLLRRTLGASARQPTMEILQWSRLSIWDGRSGQKKPPHHSVHDTGTLK